MSFEISGPMPVITTTKLTIVLL